MLDHGNVGLHFPFSLSCGQSIIIFIKEKIDRIMKEKENEERSAHDDPPRDRRLMPARTRALSQWSGSSADLLLSLVRTYKRKRKGTCGH